MASRRPSPRTVSPDRAVLDFLGAMPDQAEDFATIAGSLTYSYAEVAGALARLSDRGLVTVVRPGGPRGAAYYRLAWPEQPSLF